jgi:PAS domain S-box-containing protein
MANPTQDFERLIDNLRQQTAALESERARADAIFASIGDGAITTDELGHIERINQAGLDMMGFTREEVMDQWFPQIFVAEDEFEQTFPIIDRPISQAFITGRPVSAKLFYLRKDGSRLPVAITVSPIMLDDTPIGAVEVFRDITMDYEMDKMKDEFISIASHQLRTPATGVKQYVGMLLEGYAGTLTPKQLNMLKNAYESNERQLRIVDDLLRVAHIDAGRVRLNMQNVDICLLLRDIVREQSKKIRERKQKVTIKQSTGNIYVRMDVNRMRMVFENLIDNASKYSPERATITVEISSTAKHVTVRVRDEGVGIEKADREKLFKKFSRVNNPFSQLVGGSGLGLYWAKKIVDLHKGKISVSSRPGKGSTFKVEIPVAL